MRLDSPLPWADIRHPLCSLCEQGTVLGVTPSWSHLVQAVGRSPWVWGEGTNALEQLRLAARGGDKDAGCTAEDLQAILRGSCNDASLGVSLQIGDKPFPFTWTAVGVTAPSPGAIISAIELPVSPVSAPLDAMCVIDGTCRLVEHDASFARLLGVEARELAGLTLWQALAIGDPALAAVARATIPSLRASEIEWRWQQGGDRWLEIRWFPSGKLTSVIIADASSRVWERCHATDYEDTTSEQRRMDAIQRLAGGVAHDFNNRLSEILGNAELALTDGGLNQELRAAFESIRASAGSSAILVRQLQAFAGQETSRPKTLDLNHAIGDLLRLRKELVDEKIRLTWTPDPETPLIEADPVQIQVILEQLMSNAQDAVLASGLTGTPEIRISTGQRVVDEETCRKHLSVTPGVFARIEVSDNGCGLDDSLAPHIFEPFFTTKEAGRGSGMGLSAVQGIVAQNGGFVEVTSVPGRGSSFQVALPSRQEPSDRAEPAGTTAASQERARAVNVKGATVLLVEDEPALLLLCKRRLTRLGFQVLEAGSPAEALELAKGYPDKIDILLTDVMMPEMNGWQLSELIGEIRPGIPSLFMSGYAAEVLSQSGTLNRGVHFLPKPFQEAELMAKLQEILQLS